ncbi:MAG: hypothetical protein EHM33_15260 [Chloroflexi bacterium]|nr:MAG: hypothetical protein EHM33_15260 [Chloroflexota bacterium]
MKTRTLLLIVLLALLIGAALLCLQSGAVTLFEDGSYRAGPFSGCIRFQLCDDHLYTGENAGYVWDWGGIEWKGEPGLFFCGGHYDPQTRTFGDWWARLLPQLVTDC